METIKVKQGAFEATISKDEEKIFITFSIPKKKQEGFNADDFSYLIEHMMYMTMNKDGKYVVEYQGLDAQ
jgi:hypothetical protein